MRIGIVYLGPFPPSTGATGAERRIRDIVRGLIAQPGTEVTVFAPRPAQSPESIIHDGIPIRYLSNMASTTSGRLASRFHFWRELLAETRKDDFDWFLFYSAQLDALPAMQRLRARGVGLAAEFCDMRSVGAKATSITGVLKLLGFRLDEALLPRQTRLNLVISSHLQNHVETHAPDTPILRLPVLVDEALFAQVPDAMRKAEERYGLPQDAIVFTYVGGLWKQEGVAVLIRAFAKAAAGKPNLRLLIAGKLVKDHPNFDDAEALVQELGLTGKVVMPGWVSTDDVKIAYSRANVLVLPQTPSAFNVAALPTKLAEYAAMGKAILATRVGDVPHYFESGQNAMLVPGGDVDAMAAALADLAADSALRQRLGAAAKHVARDQFSYIRNGANILAEMQKIKPARHKERPQT